MQPKKFFFQNANPDAVTDGAATIEATDQANDSATIEAGDSTEVTVEDVSRLKETLRKLRTELKQKENEARTAQGALANVDIEEYTRLKQTELEAKQKAETAERDRLERNQEYEKLIALEKQRQEEIANEYRSELEKTRQQLSQFQQKVQTKTLSQEFTDAWTDPNVAGRPELKAGAFSQLQLEGRLRFNPDTDRVEVVNPITKDPETDDIGTPLTLKGYLATKFKSEFPAYYLPQQRGGTGALPETSSSVKTRQGNRNFDDILKMKAGERAQLLNGDRP